MSGVKKTGFHPYYYFNIYSTKTNKLICKFERIGTLLKHMIFDFKVNPSDPEEFYFTLWNNEESIISKVNIFKGSHEALSKWGGISSRPNYFLLNETWNNAFIIAPGYVNSTYWYKLYSHGVKESLTYDLNSDKGHKNTFGYSFISFIDGANFLTLSNNDFNVLEAFWNGQVNFKKVSSNNEYNYIYGFKDAGLDNNRMIVISSMSNQEWKIEVFPNSSKANHFSYNFYETTLMKFNYPDVLMVKGGRELFLYNVNENLWYYTFLPSPILLESTTLHYEKSYIELYCLMDMGDYLIRWNFNFYTSSQNYIEQSIYKRYLEKSNFPKSKMLTYFDNWRVKFVEEESAIVIQFENCITSYGLSSYNLVEKSESYSALGEIIHIEGDGLYYWKKGGQSLTYKPFPLNFTDR